MPVELLMPLPALLAGGAGVVLGAAAALSGWAARRPDLKAQRWSRPLPGWLRVAVDAPALRLVVRIAGVVATATGLTALARHPGPVDGLTAVAIITALSLGAGPVWRMVNPARIGLPPQPAPDAPDADVRPAAAWLAGLGLVALSTHSGRTLAVTGAAYLVVQAILTWRSNPQRPGRHDAVAVLADLVGQMAPVARDTAGRLAWRNPLVAATHATLPRGALLVIAVLIGLTATHALGVSAAGIPDLAPAALRLIAGTATVGALLHLAMIRPFFRSAALPVAAAYGLMAGGRWWPPVDLLVFVGLHVAAVAMLHRQALARHDLRTARALQFPPRLLLVVSVTCGLALLVGRLAE